MNHSLVSPFCQVFSKSDLIWKNIFFGWQQFLLLVSQGVGGDGRGKKCGLAYVEHGSRWSWTFEGQGSHCATQGHPAVGAIAGRMRPLIGAGDLRPAWIVGMIGQVGQC